MDLSTTRRIMHTVLSTPGAATRLQPLLKERAFKGNLGGGGDPVAVGEIDRMIEELAGHYHEGKFIGAAKIIEASAICDRYAGTHPEITGTHIDDVEK